MSFAFFFFISIEYFLFDSDSSLHILDVSPLSDTCFTVFSSNLSVVFSFCYSVFEKVFNFEKVQFINFSFCVFFQPKVTLLSDVFF